MPRSSLVSTLAASLATPLVLASSPAAAHPDVAPLAAPAPAPDASYSANDWILSILSADLAGAAGGLVGGAIGYGLAGSCTVRDDEETWFDDCAWHGLGEAAIGFTLGSTFAGGAGAYAYGQLTGHRGSYWAATGGWVVGLGATLGVVALTDDDDVGGGIRVAAALVLPALGATAGYVLSLESGDDDAPPPTGSLIETSRDGVRLSAPNVALGLDAKGGFDRVELGLVGGRF